MCEPAKAKCGVLCAGAKSVIMCLGGVVVLAHVIVHVVVCLDTVRFARTPTVPRLRALLWTMRNNSTSMASEWLIVGLTVETGMERTD